MRRIQARLASFLVVMVGFIFLIFLGLLGCKHSIDAKGKVSGETVARVIVDFPQTQACFNDPRIIDYGQLKECLELVTNFKVTLSADGEVIEAIKAELPTTPTPITGGL